MPTSTYTPIATITLASTDSAIEFGSIPATYRDLVLVYTGSTTASGGVNLTVNGDTSITRVFMYDGGASGTSGTSNGQEIFYSYTSQSNAIMQFLDYSATDKHKTILTRSNTGVTVFAEAQRWASTAAITTILLNNKTFNIGSTFSLYGIAA